MSDMVREQDIDRFVTAFRAALEAQHDVTRGLATLIPIEEGADDELNAGQQIKVALRDWRRALWQRAAGGDDVFLLRPVDREYEIRLRYGDPIRIGSGLRSEGIVFAAPVDTPVVAPFFGRVIMAGDDKTDYGARVVIESNDARWHVWLIHLGRVDVAVGEEVEAGSVVGATGQSGNASFPQLLMVLQQQVGGLPNKPGFPQIAALQGLVDPWPHMSERSELDVRYRPTPKAENV